MGYGIRSRLLRTSVLVHGQLVCYIWGEKQWSLAKTMRHSLSSLVGPIDVCRYCDHEN